MNEIGFSGEGLTYDCYLAGKLRARWEQVRTGVLYEGRHGLITRHHVHLVEEGASKLLPSLNFNVFYWENCS